jgi:dihydrofolate reductase
MRRLILTQNVSLDGSPEMLTDWFAPQGQGLGEPVDESDLVDEIHRQDATADALLVGRQTFTDFRGYWRDLEDDTTGISAYLNAVQKYVVSSKLTEPEWQNTTILGGDLVAAVRELKQQDGQDIVCTGSISLSHALIAAGLVDEFRLFTYPAVQGRGRRLFPEGYEVARLRLLEATTFRNGVVLTRYAAVSGSSTPS